MNHKPTSDWMKRGIVDTPVPHIRITPQEREQIISELTIAMALARTAQQGYRNAASRESRYMREIQRLQEQLKAVKTK